MKYFKYLIFLLPIFLTGCWNYEDINKRNIAITIGIESIQDNVQFSAEMVNLKGSNDNKFSGFNSTYNVSSTGKNFEEARHNLNIINPHPIFLGATRAVIFDKKYAQNGIESYLNRIDSLYDYRKTVLTVVSRESPAKLFTIGTEKHLSVGFLIEDGIYYLSKNGQAIYTESGQLLSHIALGNVGFILPYIGTKNNVIQLLGFAVFKNSKLIGIIDYEDADGIIYLLADNPRIIQNINDVYDDKNSYSFETTFTKKDININYYNNQVHININIDAISKFRYQYKAIEFDSSKINYFQDKISDNIKKEIIKVMEKAQQEFKCDIFQYYKYFKADNPNLINKIDWESAFNAAEININVNNKVIDLNNKR